MTDLNTANLKLNDLGEVSFLGGGSYGNVTLVRKKDGPLAASKNQFALKQISKKHIVDQKLQKHVQQERSCMALMRHRFIIYLYTTFQDNDSLYFLMDLVEGPDLYYGKPSVFR